MAPVIHLRQQLAMKLEGTEGTEATSFVAADLIRVMEPELEFLPNVFERPLVREAFGLNPQFHATMAAELRFSVEMAGDTRNVSSWVAAPAWSRLLRCCGYTVDNLFQLSVTSSTITGGPIQHGETLTEATTLRTAVAVSDWYTGASSIWVRTIPTAFSGGNVVTGGTSGATFTSLASGTSAQLGGVQQGFVWYPTTTGGSTGTFYFMNDTEQMILYGARGTVEIDGTVHDRVVLRFTFRGIFKSWTAGALFNNTLANTYMSLRPPAFVNVGATITDTSGTLSGADFVFRQLMLSIGNQLEMRENANGANGYLACVINDRQPSGSLQIEQPGASTWNFVDKMLNGTLCRLNVAWGTTQYNRFQIKADHVQIAGLQRGVVAQRATWDTTLRLTSGNIYGASDNSPGADNELIIFHT